MIWLIILSPVIIVSAIAIYFGFKSGTTPPDESQLAGKPEEIINPMKNMNTFGP
ncbi:hypothetical protein J7E81_28310 [Bacillus sp. ISL-18]|uniref:hypothetical protein n=1 Tax=Bacillus sp. ISL-18 TaxID=2819118 RepID=UPI001BE6BEA4|nr:hypothetical protein [Bacillus sp. ISL-18]MBT2659080.1 hypothetical protein [Bacillus sp. ISL-18]